jgi:GNAT superfamily N-acetyltransferase
MKISTLDLNNPGAVKKFIKFPFDLYRQVPQWVPPLASQAQAALNPHKHPFYRHSEAQFFLAEQDGQVVGRIAAIHNRNHAVYTGRRTGFFGFFEVVEDQAAAQGLFEAAFEWFRARNLDEVIGPRGLVGSDSGGILVEGFEHRPALGVPYNLPYYDRFIQSIGFAKSTDHLSGYLPGNHPLPERILRIAERVKKRRGLWIKSFTRAQELREWVGRVANVHSQAFIHNHEYFPPTPEEIQGIADTLVEVGDPRLIKLVMHADQVVGFVLAYHDISPALQRCGGRIWPLGWLHILLERRRADWVNVNGIGLLPEYRGLGGDTLLFAELARSVYALGFKHIEIVQVNETNFESRSDMETIGVQWYKRHRNYAMRLP